MEIQKIIAEKFWFRFSFRFIDLINNNNRSRKRLRERLIHFNNIKNESITLDYSFKIIKNFLFA